MTRTVILAALLTVALAAPAAAAETRGPCPQHWYTPEGYEIAIGGCYLPDTDELFYTDRVSLWHERGHRFDSTRLTAADRAWLSRRFFDGRPWVWPTSDPLAQISTHAPPARELFAEAYGRCHVPMSRALLRARRRGAQVGTQGAYGYEPYTRQHRELCNAVAVLDLIR